MGILFDHPGLGAALQAEYEHLATPAFSYQVQTNANGALRWRDAATDPPQLLTREPDASTWRRLTARVLGWLPIESQL